MIMLRLSNEHLAILKLDVSPRHSASEKSIGGMNSPNSVQFIQTGTNYIKISRMLDSS